MFLLIVPKNGDFLKGLYNIHRVKPSSLAMTWDCLLQTVVVTYSSCRFSCSVVNQFVVF